MADDKEVQEQTIADEQVLKKYKEAGVLKQLIDSVKPGVSVKAICEKGDRFLTQETEKKYKDDKEMKKGIAFPTCLSVNNCICHFSPSKNDPDLILKEEDLVKIDLGAHIDGYIAVVAFTLVVGASLEKKVKGRKADVILAAYNAAQATLRLVKNGKGNYEVTEAVQKIAESFKCKPIEGMLSHQLKQFKIDGEKTIIQNPTAAQKKEHEKVEFENYEVYAMDVLVSSGEGSGKELDTKVSIYKKTDVNYLLKLKASKAFYAEVKKKYQNMPFNLRNFEEEAKAKMGVVECVSHKLIEPFQVLYEKHNEFVAQFKSTLMLLPNGTILATGIPIDLNLYESEYSVKDEELVKLLAENPNLVSGASSSSSSKNKKKKKKAAGAVGENANKENQTEKETPADKKE
ncbi:CLUMA_CG015415, isoform A [Clunio marinus]|uniref:CLUMA_CG015415, isoform A n=1 Tax=Clunio marinus TaxID=568069 RepID=A0A1J1IPR9_9DIPT|nr:CLUMA_CG015415, isoform A [Clunio marinus]